LQDTCVCAACTDVTGFGLAGHLHEMMLASGVAATIELDALPLLEGAWELSAGDIRPGRTADLITWAEDFVSFGGDVSAEEREVWQGIICDPQTSGGLLFSMNEQAAKHYLALHPSACQIGSVHDGTPGHLHFS